MVILSGCFDHFSKPDVRAKCSIRNNGPILLKNSKFGQLSALHQNAVPLALHFENVVFQRRAHETLVLISGGVFRQESFSTE